MADDKALEKKSETVVPVVDGPEHGYFGTVRDDTPNEDYTTTGVTRQQDGPADESGADTESGADDEPKPAKRPAKS